MQSKRSTGKEESKKGTDRTENEKFIQRVPITLFIKGRNLKNLDRGSKSDPQCVIYQKDLDTEEYRYIGHTEILENNLEPDYEKGIEMDFFFHQDQLLKLTFVDNDDGPDEDGLAEGEDIGSAYIGLPKIMAAEAHTITAPIFLELDNG